MSGDWRPGIGDPSVLGWVTVVAYFATAACCALAGRKYPASRFWDAMAAVMLLLGVNKQLDLQTLLTQIGRNVTQRYGWYEDRRFLQAAFILMVVVSGVVGIGMSWKRTRALRRSMRSALAGLIFIFTYVLLRASSFHHVDFFINARLLGVKWNWILELTGVAVILASACAAWRPDHARQREHD